MGYLGHWLLTASGALIILAFMLIVRWRDKRQVGRLAFSSRRFAVASPAPGASRSAPS